MGPRRTDVIIVEERRIPPAAIEHEPIPLDAQDVGCFDVTHEFAKHEPRIIAPRTEPVDPTPLDLRIGTDRRRLVAEEQDSPEPKLTHGLLQRTDRRSDRDARDRDQRYIG